MVRWLVLGLALACGTACKSHWTAEVNQPVLPLLADIATRTSWPAKIVLGDVDLRPFRFANTAYYVVVSRDRLRFHVVLRHKWESMADLREWDAWVEDDRGGHHTLEELDQRVVHIGFGNWAIYRGNADFTIYGRELAAAHRVTLVLRRPGYEYRYVWNSEAEPES